MPWEVIVHHDTRIIETKYSGQLGADELSAAVTETGEQIRVHGTGRLLADCTALAGGHSVVDLYYLADSIQSSGLAAMIKEAVLLPELAIPQETVKFWETKCLNQGLRVRVFVDRRSATDWLLETDGR